ncbi:phosphoribosyl-AMP cyclohydrolase [Aliidiomarina iranensis]|uniref:Phosphoribosyl-AMP cyclohydrolase n=1 Tax=Aliidiomarina iranensis TaxID=1434071 RepID=A0A432VWH2_9GAMM|nr:phosphoribosyl-AMP cyclohydrolase [Aliidiomarina iranensis]RUO20908.1 phosphoribosyl-AMP cyclohydrolase [Aliidiomarina iranensis]
MKRATLISMGFMAALSSAAIAATPVQNNNITESEVEAAQKAWGAALIQISKDYAANGHESASALANQVLDQAYGYSHGPVLFKPTLASGEKTFRVTQEGALSYFVGGNDYYGDGGFALKPWETYDFENAAVYINGDLALTMGHVILTDSAGDTTTVDKTWAFKKDEQGTLRIVLHHSSLPYSE